MKKIFLACLLFTSVVTRAQSVSISTDGAAADSSAMLDIRSSNKGMLLPRMTKTHRDAITRPANGLMIYQTDETPGFYFYNGASWTRVGSGFPNPGANGQVAVWNGGSTIEGTPNFYWDNVGKRMLISGLNDGSVPAAYTNWISAAIGGSGGNRVVIGVQNGDATIGAHNFALDGWRKLVLNPGGSVNVGSLAGSGNRMVIANSTGDLSTQPIPAGNSGTVTSVGPALTAGNPLTVTNNSTTPAIDLPVASSSANGYLSATDWINFNNKQGPLAVANSTTSGILSSSDWSIFNNKVNTSRTISTGAPLSGGGDLNSDRTLTIARASAGVDGYLASSDWNVFKNKFGKSSNGITAIGDSIMFGGSLVRNTTLNLDQHRFDVQTGYSNATVASVSIQNPNASLFGLQALGQSVTMPYNGTITTINVPIKTNGSTSISCYVYRGSGTGGTLAAISIFNSNQALDVNTTASFPLNLNCSAGDIFTVTFGLSVTSFTYGFRGGDTYNGGTAFLATNPVANADLNLEIVQVANSNMTSLSISPISGYVGIGISTPTTNFEVNGNSKFNALSGSGTRFVTADANGNLSSGVAVTNASASSTGLLSNVDWTSFNNKLTLPPLTQGSLLISDGNSIAQNNSKLFWDNNNFRLGVGTSLPTRTLSVQGVGGIDVTTSNAGSGTTDWIALNAGGTSGNRVVQGNLNGSATIGAHNADLTQWRPLILNPGGYTAVGDITPTAQLDVEGTVRLRNGSGANKVLTSDATGNASWSNTIQANFNGPLSGNVTGNLNGNVTGTISGGSAGNFALNGNVLSNDGSANGLQLDNAGNAGLGAQPSANNKIAISGVGGIKVSSSNAGTGSSDWIAGNYGGSSGDRLVMGNLNGVATLGAHDQALGSWSNIAINPTAGNTSTVTIGSAANASPGSLASSGALDRKLVVNGSVRQGFYYVPVNVPANNVTYVTWTHNLGYGPIVMMSTDQNGGGSYMDFVVVTTYNNNANETVFVLRNMGSSAASGNLRWILVW